MTIGSTSHLAVDAAFRALDDAGVHWCLLRGEPQVLRAADDVDLLVAASQRIDACNALQRAGYLRMASWGRGSHRFFVRYDREHDAWVKLDVVSTLDFGAHGVMETGSAAACLRRRSVVGGVPLLADQDRFWALLLHCILDRAHVPDHHATSLRNLAASIAPGGPLADWFTRQAPEAWDQARVIKTARTGDWSSLIELGRQLRSDRRWRRASPLVTRIRRGTARRLTKVRKAVVEPGLTLALLGPDGAGKSTLASGLGRTFFFPVRSVYMGLYGAGSPAGRPPRGLIGRLARQWAGYMRAVGHRYRGRLVVYDRFGYDVLLRGAQSTGARARVRRWLLSRAIPAPDLVVLLDAPSALLYARKQEQDIRTLEAQRLAYLELASRLDNVRIVNADQSAENVRRDVTDLAFRAYVARRGRARAIRGG